jgi:hypothetical protein
MRGRVLVGLLVETAMAMHGDCGSAVLTADDTSDGIARVHGMANVQAEELVE